MMQGLFKSRIYFVQLVPDKRCGNNSRARRSQGNTVFFGWLYITRKPQQVFVNKSVNILDYNYTCNICVNTVACTSISRSLGMSTIGASMKSSTRVLVAMIDVSVDKLLRHIERYGQRENKRR